MKKTEPLPPKAQPPPYNTGLYPLITGTVDIKGEVTQNGENKDCDTQGGKGPPIHIDCYEGIRKAREEWNSADNSSSDSDYGDEDGKNYNKLFSEICMAFKISTSK